MAKDRGQPGWGRVALRLLVGLTLLVGAYGALVWWAGDHIPNGTSVGGVDVGGTSLATARERVATSALSQVERPLTISVGEEESLTLDPAQAGLGYDVEASIRGLTGISYHPSHIWSRITGRGSAQPLVATVDHDRLTAAVAAQVGPLRVEPQDGAVVIRNAKVEVTEPVLGRALDVNATVESVVEAWRERTEAVGVVSTLEPRVGAAEIERFVTEEARPALAKPVTVVVGTRKAALRPEQLGAMLSVTPPASGRLGLQVDEPALVAAVRGSMPGVEMPPQNASVEISGGKPVVIPAEDGARLVTDDIDTKLLAALKSPARRLRLAVQPIPPTITSQQAASWRFDTAMATFRSEFPDTPSRAGRTANMRLALQTINGTLVMPGEQFSLSGALGPVTAARGYQNAGVIRDGVLVEGIGGGLSQVSTTLYNTAYFSGVQLDEHRAHSYWISRYPAGREATFSQGAIDNKWTNDTGAPIFIRAGMDREKDFIWMTFYGVRQYDVKAVAGEQRNVVEPKKVVVTKEPCLDQAPVPGFDITVTRVLSKDGAEVRREKVSTHYDPADEIVCEVPKPESPPKPQ